MNKKTNKGISLIEILISVLLFSFIGILSVQSIAVSIKGAKKSESQIRVKNNINYALSVIERLVRKAGKIDCASSTALVLNYTDERGSNTSFSCIDNYLASGSARLTASDIGLTACSFSCTQGSSGPAVVAVTVEGQDLTFSGQDNAIVKSTIKVVGRNY